MFEYQHFDSIVKYQHIIDTNFDIGIVIENMFNAYYDIIDTNISEFIDTNEFKAPEIQMMSPNGVVQFTGITPQKFRPNNFSFSTPRRARIEKPNFVFNINISGGKSINKHTKKNNKKTKYIKLKKIKKNKKNTKRHKHKTIKYHI
jgi:hypothetical protein